MAELVAMEEDLPLVSEHEDKSSDDLAKLISQAQPQETQPEPEPQREEPVQEEQPAAEEEVPEEAEPVEEEPAQPAQASTVNVEETYRKGARDTMELMRDYLAKSKEPEKPKTPRDPNKALEEFAENPDAYLRTQFGALIDPYKREISRLEDQRAIDAAMGNPDFRRLRPVIDSLMQKKAPGEVDPD